MSAVADLAREVQATPPETAAEENVWEILDDVLDPEVPAVSVVDLGVVRAVRVEGKAVTIDLTPTYTGCPATILIGELVKAAVESGGYGPVTVNTVLSPAWTTDWITARGRQRLKDYGIAPPVGQSGGRAALFGGDVHVTCPHCGSQATERVSEFGSTACKAMYRCTDCREPFEYFKCI
ncbi:1,2-phenylacetyl-CoA epoxidase subunit PaaD [Yunchengibacter salinarum]|uniref:1,2-phenylacetyl-CoA epoxidase subunit PaaD n=1 Tax=Yunchengibacter salinarum TaxID=3133399 RepID=UPI0035B69132